MAFDTSALVAILTNEPDAEQFEAAIYAGTVRLISAASVLETAIVTEARAALRRRTEGPPHARPAPFAESPC